MIAVYKSRLVSSPPQGHWVLLQPPWCETYAYTSCVLSVVSVWTIAALSWDEYQTIAAPLHHSLTATLRKMLPCFVALWMLGLVLSLPPLLGGNEFVYISAMGICGVNSASTSGRWYTCTLVFISFVFPFSVMVYCYTHIFRIARSQSSRIAATMFRMMNLIQAPIAPVTRTSIRGTKAMSTILQLVGSFTLTYLPNVVIILYEVCFAVHANTVVVSIGTTLFLAAPFTHGAVYGLRNKILRTSFYHYARRKIQRLSRKKDRRKGSVRYPAKRNVNHVPLKCMVRSDGKHSVLKRSASYQEGAENGLRKEFCNANSAPAASLVRPHSYNVIQDSLHQYSNGMNTRQTLEDEEHAQLIPFPYVGGFRNSDDLSDLSDRNDLSLVFPDSPTIEDLSPDVKTTPLMTSSDMDRKSRQPGDMTFDMEVMEEVHLMDQKIGGMSDDVTGSVPVNSTQTDVDADISKCARSFVIGDEDIWPDHNLSKIVITVEDVDCPV